MVVVVVVDARDGAMSNNNNNSRAVEHPRGAPALPGRIMHAAGRLTREQRLAAIAAAALFLTLFLPWYQREFFEVIGKHIVPASDSLSGWAAFSWVEAAVLLVAVGILLLLFERAVGRAFHLPGGDGTVIMVAGLWTCVLVIWRIFDKQGATARSQNATTSGIEWGIFVALGVAALLAYAGSRMRAAREPEPPLPTEGGAVFDGHWHRPGEDLDRPARRPAAGPQRAARRSRETGVHARDTEARAREAEIRPATAAARPQRAPLGPDRDAQSATDRLPEPPPGSAARSSWRPADAPEWTGEPERPLGWLSAPPQRSPAPPPREDETIRLPSEDETQRLGEDG